MGAFKPGSLPIITDEGGITCHAAIFAREMRKPCIIGTRVATKILKDGDIVSLDMGLVHKGLFTDSAVTVGVGQIDEAAKDLADKLNIEVVRNLALIAIEHKATLVHYSSDYVFKGDVAGGYDENAEPDPQSIYAETKRAGEKELISLTGKGLQWYLIRTSKLFGPKGTSPSAKLSVAVPNIWTCRSPGWRNSAYLKW